MAPRCSIWDFCRLPLGFFLIPSRIVQNSLWNSSCKILSGILSNYLLLSSGFSGILSDFLWNYFGSWESCGLLRTTSAIFPGSFWDSFGLSFIFFRTPSEIHLDSLWVSSGLLLESFLTSPRILSDSLWAFSGLSLWFVRTPPGILLKVLWCSSLTFFWISYCLLSYF